MIRFRIVLFFLFLTVFTPFASYRVFEPQSNLMTGRFLLQVNDDANPYDDRFFEPDSTGLRPGRMDENEDEIPSGAALPLPQPSLPSAQDLVSCFSREQKHVPVAVKLHRSGNMEVRAGPPA